MMIELSMFMDQQRCVFKVMLVWDGGEDVGRQGSVVEGRSATRRRPQYLGQDLLGLVVAVTCL